ncbi:MAG: STAS domain-containing protein [Planctomycetota bacterium]|nr:MAG: STAS domain-containing protein [Planctomycetota bacterium]
MATLNITCKEENLGGSCRVTIGTLDGAIDSTTTKVFEDYMQEFLNNGVKFLILQFGGVKYVNSTGMGLLIKIADRFRDAGGDLCLVGVSNKVVGLFDMLGLLPVLPLFNSMDEAKEHLKSIVQPEEEESEIMEVAPAFEEMDFEEPIEVMEEEDVYPVEFDCPVCTSGLEIPKEGKFKCPKCGCYFLADPEGDVQALRLEEAKMIELRLPSDTTFIDGLRTMTRSFGREFGYSDSIIEVMDQGIDEAFAMVVRLAQNPQELCNIFMVGNSQELITGVFSGNKRFDSDSLEIKLSMKIIQNAMDEVEIIELPSGGQLLKMKKVIRPPLQVTPK